MSKSNGLLVLSLPNRGNMFPPDTALLQGEDVFFSGVPGREMFSEETA